MKQRIHIWLQLLGVVHVLVAIVLLPVATFFGFITISVIVPGLVWLAVIGFWLWRADRTVRKALQVTHAELGLLAILLVVYGWFCLQAAQRSAEVGGGLLGAVGLIPIVIGMLIGSLSVVSLFTAQSDAFVHIKMVGQSFGGDSEKTDGGPPRTPQGNLHPCQLQNLLFQSDELKIVYYPFVLKKLLLMLIPPNFTVFEVFRRLVIISN